MIKGRLFNNKKTHSDDAFDASHTANIYYETTTTRLNMLFVPTLPVKVRFTAMLRMLSGD